MSIPTIGKESGLTITETVIVLAIAGIILSMVLFAIPNLQRNSRNNQRKQDVQTVLQAVSQYELNNSGTVPDTPNLKSFLDSYYKDKLVYYTPSDITVCPTTPVVNPPFCATSHKVKWYDNESTLDTIIVNNHGKCLNLAGSRYTNLGAGYSDVVALYRIETRSGSSPKCQEL